MQYDPYPIPEDKNQDDAMVLVYNDSMQYNVLKKRKSVPGCADFFNLSDENEAADNIIYKNMAAVAMTGDKDERVDTDLWPDYSVDAQIVED